MKARKRFQLIPPLGFLLIPWTSAVKGEDVDLRLEVEGTIQPQPTWRDANNMIISNLTFIFDGIANPNRINQDVDSEPSYAKLVDAGKQMLTPIELYRPKKCRIGDTGIDDAHVQFVHNNHVHRKDAQILIMQYRLHELRIRFASQGSYGGLSGAVRCDLPGMLRYTYD